MVSWKNAESHPGSVSAAPIFYFGTSGSGKSVTVQSAIQLSTVYACVRVISETIASLPLGIYETVNDGKTVVMKPRDVLHIPGLGIASEWW